MTESTGEYVEEGVEQGECEHCGDQGRIYSDNKRCEDCDGEFVTCSICEEEQHRDSSCRHVFQDSNYEYSGSGAYEPGEHIKESFLRLLSKMPVAFASDLKETIRSGGFYTFASMPIIGGGHIGLYGKWPRREGLNWDAYSDALTSLGEDDNGEDDEAMSDGYHWLASLYKDDTPVANELTTTWIDEFLGKPVQP